MDLLSSPDPLNASIESAITPSYSRRVTRSQTSSRYASMAGSSPRKQTFELDVGNANSPQKILVTVEAEETDKENVSRRLFGTPTPKRSVRRTEKATTTTVPLKGLTDDESGWRDTAATPRRRGRPPKNGTPSTQTRKKTPAKPRLTPGRPRRARSTTDELLGSEISVATDQATPQASARSRRTVKRKTATLTTDDEQIDDAAPPKRRGRKRRQAIAPEDVVILEDHTSDADASSMRSNSMQPDMDTASEAGVLGSIDMNGDARTDDDIWITSLEDSQRSMRRTRSRRQQDTTVTQAPLQEEPDAISHEVIDVDFDDAEANDLMQIDDHSDVESNMSEKSSTHRPDQDTIVDGENFTMISMDSVPSLQAQLHLPSSDLPEMGETTSLIINKTLESLRQSVVLEDEEPDQPEGEKTPTAVSPAKSTMSIQNDTPRANSLAVSTSGSPLSRVGSPRRSPRRSRAQPLGRQLALKSLQKDDQFQTEELSRSNTSPRRANIDDVTMYEDSFSEIPEAVLEAATPRRLQGPSVEFEAETTEELEALHEAQQDQYEEEVQYEQEDRPMTSHSVTSQAESSRLLTPDETPSPTDDSSEKGEKQATSRIATSEPRSSPPVFNISQPQHLGPRSHHSRQSSTETPKAIPSSLASASNQVLLPHDIGLAPPSSGSRPALSPIVRAGRTLQSILSDPPSPSARGSVLGSPFQGSQRISSPIVTEELSPTANKTVTPQPAPMSGNPERSWSKMFAPFSQLKNLVAQGAQSFSPLAQNSQMLDDPFGPSSSKLEQTGASEVIGVAQQDTTIDDELDHEISIRSTTRVDLRSEDEMSWVADSNPFITTKSLSHSGNSSLLDKEQSVSRQSHMIQTDNVPVQDAVHDNDDDIWAVEAQRRTPALRQESDFQEQPLSSPKKGLLSNLWGATSRISFPSNSGRENLSAEIDRQPSESPVRLQEEYSLLSLSGLRGNQPADKIEEPGKQEPAKSRRVDLSAFFSSSPAFTARFGRTESQASMSQVPKNGGQLESSVHGSGALTSGLPSVIQGEVTSGRETRARTVSVDRQDQPGSEDFVSHSVSPATPERPTLAHVPQKRNFTPLLGQSRSSLFAPSPAVALEPQDSPMEEDSDEEMHESSRMTHESDFEPPVLKPLPDRAASPTKSCLRSPLKPKTPGRVVEFTSSVLSPLAQAQARAERQNQVSLGSSIMAAQGTSAPVAEKENPRPGLSFSILATPKHRHLQQKQVNSPLSQSQWTKKHWVRLDELLQQYRRAPLEFQLKYGGVTPQKRKSSVLLGKQVTSQGETMLLEQWHLDIVDAFKKEVGGWDENELAKRLFAVMVGEERRRLGLVPKRR